MKRNAGWQTMLWLTSVLGSLLVLLALGREIQHAPASFGVPLPIWQSYLPIVFRQPRLVMAANPHGIRHVGVAVTSGQLADANFTDALVRDFNSVTPEVEMKMQWTQPCPPQWLIDAYPDVANWIENYSGVRDLDPGFVVNCKDPENRPYQGSNLHDLDSLEDCRKLCRPQQVSTNKSRPVSHWIRIGCLSTLRLEP